MADETPLNSRLLSLSLPTFFELLAKDGLDGALRKAVQFATKVMCSALAHRCGLLFHYRMEYSEIVQAAVDGIFILTQGGSFVEYFYNLERLKPLPQPRLPLRNRLLSLLFVVGLPYVKMKMEDIYRQSCEQQDSGETVPHQWKWFVKMYPILHFIEEVVKLLFNFSYLIDKSKYYSLELWMSGVCLNRHTKERVGGSVRWLSVAMLGAAYVMRFLDWWMAEEGRTARQAVTALPNPPPPRDTQVQNLSPANVCPMCHSCHSNPTTLTTSGYVYCYSCIIPHVRQHQSCPLTRLPTLEGQCVRLYTSNT